MMLANSVAVTEGEKIRSFFVSLNETPSLLMVSAEYSDAGGEEYIRVEAANLLAQPVIDVFHGLHQRRQLTGGKHPGGFFLIDE